MTEKNNQKEFNCIHNAIFRVQRQIFDQKSKFSHFVGPKDAVFNYIAFKNRLLCKGKEVFVVHGNFNHQIIRKKSQNTPSNIPKNVFFANKPAEYHKTVEVTRSKKNIFFPFARFQYFFESIALSTSYFSSI